ncbi:MAG: YggT family protein [Stellaceae bacterium]
MLGRADAVKASGRVRVLRPGCANALRLRTPAAKATVAPPSTAATATAEVSPLMYALLSLVNTVITIYIWLLIIQAVLSWLVAFGVVNRHNRAVAMAGDFLWRITEPLLRPIRRFLPDLGGIDISPVILILLLYFADNLMFEYLG